MKKSIDEGEIKTPILQTHSRSFTSENDNIGEQDFNIWGFGGSSRKLSGTSNLIQSAKESGYYVTGIVATEYLTWTTRINSIFARNAEKKVNADETYEWKYSSNCFINLGRDLKRKTDIDIM